MASDPTGEHHRDLLATNERFYEAFSKRDFAALSDLWHPTLPLVCIHPGWPPLEGRDAVLGSWRRILQNPASPPVRCVSPRVSLMNELALVVCFEVVRGSRLVATNGYAPSDGRWRMVFHQAGPVAYEDDEEEVEEKKIEPSDLN